MNEITAIIQPHTLSKVMHALRELPSFPGVTLLDAHGQGHGLGEGGAFRPTEDSFAFHKKTLLLITCEANLTEEIVRAIVRTAHTGNKGDGIITVKDVRRTIRIRTGEPGEQGL
ncbi:MAG: P-II family nitrogen regulator [Verrucomicrobia bacterium]|nr:P-II family nitrogen regulator [Verrucomicrobiota bacterium]